MVFFGWMTFTLQSMRIRDIGWDPVCVIPAWIAILIVERSSRAKFRRGRSTMSTTARSSARWSTSCWCWR